MTSPPIYDTIGVGYAKARRADARVEAQIHNLLGGAASILNIGAGTGNYEPTDRLVLAVEPAGEMLRQRTNSHPVVQGVAEALPVADDSFDVSMGILTVHHWTDRNRGLRELKRVSRQQLLWVYDPEITKQFWLAEYFPSIAVAPWEVNAPTPADLAEVLDVVEVRTLEIPADCTDGFTGCYWNRPDRYLDPDVQAGMSTLSKLDQKVRAEGCARLAADLESGAWDAKYGELRTQESFDIGYRLVLAGQPIR